MTLLTPNWLSQLPGMAYDGPDPDGYMTSEQVAELITRFAAVARAPLRTGTEVRSLRRAGDGYQLRTAEHEIHADTVVIASGACNIAAIPALAEQLPAELTQLSAHGYRNPDQLPDGGVLVVGASATGVQIAAELQRSGRAVTLAVGEHVRMPRTYRGRDVLWWMHAAGVWDQRHDELDDLARARSLPSPQLIGTPERATLDLNALTALGVELVGRLASVRDGRALFSGGLRNVFALADLKLERLLDGFDEWALTAAAGQELSAPERLAPTVPPRSPRLQLDLRSGEIRTVLWATGFRPDYAWLDVPVTDAKGALRHDGGVVSESPGLYALGLPVLRRRKSTFIHGIEDDARDVVAQLVSRLDSAGQRGSRRGRSPGLPTPA
jgi:putative flavoprotein involved in K+ transport